MQVAGVTLTYAIVLVQFGQDVETGCLEGFDNTAVPTITEVWNHTLLSQRNFTWRRMIIPLLHASCLFLLTQVNFLNIARAVHNFYKYRPNIKSCLPLLPPKPTKRLWVCYILGFSVCILYFKRNYAEKVAKWVKVAA